MRSLVPLQKEIIVQQQELYDRAVAMFDGVVEDETQQDHLCNILMGIENTQIRYSFTIHDVVQYHLIFLAAIELIQGSSGPAPKKRTKSLRRDEFYQTYLRATVQCAWNCALTSLGCTSAELRDIVGMHAVMVLDHTRDGECRITIQAVKFRHTTFPDLYNYLCNFIGHCCVKTKSRICATFPKWQEFERVVPDREGGDQQSESSEYTMEEIAGEEGDAEDEDTTESENPNLNSPIVAQSKLKRAASSGNVSHKGGNTNDMQLVVMDNDEAGASDSHANGCNSNDHMSQDCSVNSNDHITEDSLVNKNDKTKQDPLGAGEGLLCNSVASLSKSSVMTREKVERKVQEYTGDVEGLDDFDRNFDQFINILSTPRNSMIDHSGRLSLTQADWTILRNSVLFCSMFFSTLMRQVLFHPPPNVFFFSNAIHLMQTNIIGNATA